MLHVTSSLTSGGDKPPPPQTPRCIRLPWVTVGPQTYRILIFVVCPFGLNSEFWQMAVCWILIMRNWKNFDIVCREVPIIDSRGSPNRLPYATVSNKWAGIDQSVWRLATGWTVRGSNPGGERDSPHLSRPALEPTQPPIQWVPGH
jgi:hypothetical protein